MLLHFIISDCRLLTLLNLLRVLKSCHSLYISHETLVNVVGKAVKLSKEGSISIIPFVTKPEFLRDIRCLISFQYQVIATFICEYMFASPSLTNILIWRIVSSII